MLPITRFPWLALAITLILALGPVAAHADWLPNGSPIAGQDTEDQWPSTMVSDGTGGAIVGWGELDLHASRLTQSGDIAPGWPADGTLLQWGSHYAFFPLTVADGFGGAFVVFSAKDCMAHCGPDPTELRAQRVTAGGVIAKGWGPNGVSVGSGFGPEPARSLDYGNTVAIPDGRGGVIVVWSSRVNRDGRGPVELRAQRIDGSGTLRWGDAGRLVRSTTPHPFLQAAAPDGDGGAILFWQDERSPGLFAQHLSRSGSDRWTTNGIPVPRAGFTSLSRPAAIEDGSHGAIVAWVGTAARDSGIFASRVTCGGGLPWREPVRVLDAASGIDSLRMVPVRGGAILAWRDSRGSTGEAVFAQRIGRDGRTQWPSGGAPVCTATGHKDYLALAPDGRDGAYFAWGDTRPAGEVFATHLEGDGEPVRGWPRDGAPVCAPVASVWAVQLVSDGAGGAIVAWTDDRHTFGQGFPLRTTLAMRLLRGGVAMPPAARTPAPRAVSLTAPVESKSASPAFALRGMQPNPGSHGSLVRFALPDDTPATLELFDTAGRRLWSRDVGSLGVGEHAVRLCDGAWLPPGIYLTRLVQGMRVATARIAVIR